MLRAALILAVIPPYVVIASMLGYPIARLLGSPRLLYNLGRFGCRMLLFLAGTRVVVEGSHHRGPQRNVVIMPNHVSQLDAPVLALIFGDVDFKAVVKKELFRIPFFHYCLRFAGFIEVDRSAPSQSKRAIAAAVSSLKAGNCFLIFPEGTRTRTGALGEFKKGAFLVAMEAGSRILPVALSGFRELLPRGGLRIRPGTVHVRVLDPVDAGRYSYDSRDALIAEVRGRIATALGEPAPRMEDRESPWPA
jgi:1-acyl-sn-glycerol-3-phosphate acyltransferase